MASFKPLFAVVCLTFVVPAAWTWAGTPADERRPALDGAKWATAREFSDAPSRYGDAWHD